MLDYELYKILRPKEIHKIKFNNIELTMITPTAVPRDEIWFWDGKLTHKIINLKNKKE